MGVLRNQFFIQDLSGILWAVFGPGPGGRMVVGIGIDSVEVERIRTVFGKRGDKAMKRVYTQGEIDYASRFKDPFPNLAARFAAKEAFFKAVGGGIPSLSDIEVIRESGSAPLLSLRGKAMEVWKAKGSPAIFISLTHNTLTGAAMIVLEKLD